MSASTCSDIDHSFFLMKQMVNTLSDVGAEDGMLKWSLSNVAFILFFTGILSPFAASGLTWTRAVLGLGSIFVLFWTLH